MAPCDTERDREGCDYIHQRHATARQNKSTLTIKLVLRLCRQTHIPERKTRSVTHLKSFQSAIETSEIIIMCAGEFLIKSEYNSYTG